MPREIVTEWLEKAEEDFGFASENLKHTDYFAQICFHFQQSAEKYLKAFILAGGLDFRPVHNLIELLEICKQKTPIADNIREACLFLNPFYIDTRYPVHWPTHYDKNIASQAKEATAKIRMWVTDFCRRTLLE